MISILNQLFIQVEDPLAKMYIKDEFTRLFAGKNFGEAAAAAAAAAAGFKGGFPPLNPFSAAGGGVAEDLAKSQADIQQVFIVFFFLFFIHNA